MELTCRDLSFLLEGLDIRALKPHGALKFKSVL